jgi:hypothetical protein
MNDGLLERMAIDHRRQNKRGKDRLARQDIVRLLAQALPQIVIREDLAKRRCCRSLKGREECHAHLLRWHC